MKNLGNIFLRWEEAKKCNQANCRGELVLRESQYGPYWKCTKCGHIIDGKCKVCGSSRILTVYEGISVARCTNMRCKKYQY